MLLIEPIPIRGVNTHPFIIFWREFILMEEVFLIVFRMIIKEEVISSRSPFFATCLVIIWMEYPIPARSCIARETAFISCAIMALFSWIWSACASLSEAGITDSIVISPSAPPPQHPIVLRPLRYHR